MYAVGFLVVWVMILRHDNLASLTWDDIRSHAVFHKTDSREGPMLKPVTQTETFRQLMEELRGESKAAADSLVFPGWCKNVARVLIRECSLVYKWRQDVEWDGPHTIRHQKKCNYLTSTSVVTSSSVCRYIYLLDISSFLITGGTLCNQARGSIQPCDACSH